MAKLYYLGKPDDFFGWGVANTNIVRALGEFCDVVVDTDESHTKFDAPVFVPISDHHLTPLRKVRAPRVLGYCFTEWPIGERARSNARQYSVLFAGSTWNVQRLAAHGIKAEVLHQGIDLERFAVQPPSARAGFVIFSGGKFEYRKGQDIVIGALRHFMAQRKDTYLLAAWHNPWSASAASMSMSNLLDDWQNPVADLPAERVKMLPPVPNAKTPQLYGMAHIGLFPNRCEAGTNLVMCEFMACGRPVIASDATGHADIFQGSNGSYLLRNGSYDPAGWFNPNVSDLLAWLEHAYQNRDELAARAAECRKLVERFTWRACASKIFQAAFPVGPHCEGHKSPRVCSHA